MGHSLVTIFPINRTGLHCTPVEIPVLQVQCRGLNLHLLPGSNDTKEKRAAAVLPLKPPPCWRPSCALDPGERSLASGAGDFKAQQRVNTGYFVPLTWPLSGMEFGIGGRRVDNGVTTSGKEVQEALVNLDCTHRLAKRAKSSTPRENTCLSVQGNTQREIDPNHCGHPSKSYRLETLDSMSEPHPTPTLGFTKPEHT